MNLINNLNKYTTAIIDDREDVRYPLQKGLSKFGYNVISFDKAEDVLSLLKNNNEKIDLIISDIKLQEGLMDGMELLRHIKAIDNSIPVIIITGNLYLEYAIDALRFGASDFFTKPFDIHEIASVVKRILKRKHEEDTVISQVQFLDYCKEVYRIPSDELICNTISYEITKYLYPMGFCDQNTSDNISLVLRESIDNAMFHGNLELSSDIRETEGFKVYLDEMEKRKTEKKYKDRRVTITYELSRDYVEYIIEDEGRGFDYNSLPDPNNPEEIIREHGRGILIIRSFMDEVDWNERGNRIRFRKYSKDGKKSG